MHHATVIVSEGGGTLRRAFETFRWIETILRPAATPHEKTHSRERTVLLQWRLPSLLLRAQAANSLRELTDSRARMAGN